MKEPASHSRPYTLERPHLVTSTDRWAATLVAMRLVFARELATPGQCRQLVADIPKRGHQGSVWEIDSTCVDVYLIGR